MLMAFDFFNIGESIKEFFIGVLLNLDAIIYSLISWVYKVILALCGSSSNIFNDTEAINTFISRVYVIIGIVMMFMLAYSLLRSLVNPDEITKGKQSPVAIIKNVVISIALIAFVPTIFEFAYGFQNAILSQNTIGKIVLGSNSNGSGEDSGTIIDEGGSRIGATLLGGFLHPNLSEDGCSYEGGEYNCPNIKVEGYESFNDFWDDVETTGDYFALAQLKSAVVDGSVSYLWLFSSLAGIFSLFVLIGYCFDIALRVIKLAVCELIAPIPILCRVAPGDQGGKVFSNWLKATVSIYIEVFMRLAVLFFAIWIMDIVVKNFGSIISIDGTMDVSVFLVAQVLIFLGIIMFIQQAPNIIKEITGLDSGKFNPLKTFKQGLGFVAGGLAGRSLMAGMRAYNELGEAKNLLDFNAIGNQYKRRQAAIAAKELQENAGLNRSQRFSMNAQNGVRKAFGFGTLKEQADRNIEHGIGIDGSAMTVQNDTGENIVLRDADGNVVRTLVAGAQYDVDDALIGQLQHQKDLNKINVSRADETIRQIKENQDLNKRFIDLRSQIKSEALDKIAEGDSAIVDTITDHTGKAIAGNYKTLMDYVQSRRDNGASTAEMARLNAELKAAQDRMWVKYADGEIARGDSTKIGSLFRQARDFHDRVGGVYDAATGTVERVDSHTYTFSDGKGGTITRTLDMDSMEFFEGARDISGTRINGADGSAKSSNSLLDIQAAQEESVKSTIATETTRIDRVLNQFEEGKATEKTSARYQAYKAADDASKLTGDKK